MGTDSVPVMLPAVVLRPTESDSAEDCALRTTEAAASADATLTAPEVRTTEAAASADATLTAPEVLLKLAAREPVVPTPDTSASERPAFNSAFVAVP
jgi:hypothetical protein